EDVRRALRLFENWRHELMGDNFDETSIQSGKTTKGRNLESFLKRTIGDIFEGTKVNPTTYDILQRARSEGFDDDRVMQTLETLRINGTIYSPSFGSWALP
ncbi:MAG: hypothetical protein CL983_02390, partial [Euryarchaeota archaeon]|nr:hypothetical protein [Euryarchaeota archaeon]